MDQFTTLWLSLPQFHLRVSLWACSSRTGGCTFRTAVLALFFTAAPPAPYLSPQISWTNIKLSPGQKIKDFWCCIRLREKLCLWNDHQMFRLVQFFKRCIKQPKRGNPCPIWKGGPHAARCTTAHSVPQLHQNQQSWTRVTFQLGSFRQVKFANIVFYYVILIFLY